MKDKEVKSLDPPLKLKWNQRLAVFLLKLFDWRVEGTLPQAKKFVAIGANHTSNWDWFFAMMLPLYFGVRLHWLGKDKLFRAPYGWFFKLCGGIAVDRSAPQNLVVQLVDNFNQREKFILGILPEGTRRKVPGWKTGFYHIAYQADVPILMAYLDYKHKVCGVGPAFVPSGDIEADIEIIREFYSDRPGKYQEKMSEIILAPRKK